MKKGFSLAELLVVIAILAVLAVVAIPAYHTWMQQYYLKEEAQKLNDVIRKTQSMVITSQEAYYIEFAPTSNAYFIKNPDDTIKEDYQLTRGIFFNAVNIADNKVHFTNLGIPDHPGTIVLQNKINQTKTVEISPSGFVKVY